MKPFKIISGQSELTKQTKYGYCTIVYDDTPQHKYHLTPEDTKLRLFQIELFNKGWSKDDIYKLTSLASENTNREHREDYCGEEL